MNQPTRNILQENAIYFAECFQQTVKDMVGTSITFSPEQVRECEFRPRNRMVVMIHYTGAIQGEYAVALQESTAAALIGVYSAGMSPAELIALRPEYTGFIKEALNAAVGSAIIKLGADFEDLTFLPPIVVFGELEYPTVPCALVPGKFQQDPIESMFILNMMGLELGDRLQAALLELRNSTKETAVARRNMQSMLAAFPAGLLILDPRSCILPGYSLCANQVVGADKDTSLVGMHFIDALGFDDPDNSMHSRLDAWLTLCHSHFRSMGFRDLRGLDPLVEKQNTRGKLLRVDWIPIEDDQGELSAMLAMVEDITEKRRLELMMKTLSKQHEQNVELMSQVINLEADEISEFVYDSTGLLQEAKRIVHQSERDRKFVDSLYRTIHTLKGNSGQFNFKSLQSLTAEIEKDLSKIRDSKVTPDQERLTSIISGIEEADGFIQKLEELRAKLGASSETMESKASRAKPSLMVAISDIKDAGKRVHALVELGKDRGIDRTIQQHIQSIGTAIDGLLRIDVRQYDGLLQTAVEHTAEKLAKEVKLLVTGNAQLDLDIFRKWHMAMIHLINNSIDHGIEPPWKRSSLGKVPMGIIQIHWSMENGMARVSFKDDGAGVTIQAIRDKLLEKTGMEEYAPESMSEAALLDLLFLPGFSTRSMISETSGHGVGLDVVRSTVQELGGTVSISTTAGKGTEFIAEFPAHASMNSEGACP